MTDAIRDHWNQRATLGATAGTQDLIAKELEQRAILRALATLQPRTVLEVGCGRGELARRIAARFPEVTVLAVDSAEAMIAGAREIHAPANLAFDVLDARDLAHDPRRFDAIVTERMLINLLTWREQRSVLHLLAGRLTAGGHIVLCENSASGLAAVNATRGRWGLDPIQEPWHNRYLSDAMRVWGLRLVRRVDFSSTYYFLSRVLNAWWAKRRGRQPAYDAWINRQALWLPSVGPWSQGRLWIWEKR